MRIFDQDMNDETLILYVENNMDADEPVIKKYIDKKPLTNNEENELSGILEKHIEDIKCSRCGEMVFEDGIEALLSNEALCGYCDHMTNKGD